MTSIKNKVERAKKGIPTSGKYPYGRIWDEKACEWKLDPNKQAMIQDAAKRYLAGVSLELLAKEYGISRVHLCKILRERCGTDWSIRFYAPQFKIDETVPFTIPPLLDEVTIRKIRDRLKAKSVRPVVRKHRYLLGGRIFCSGCGYCLEGHANARGARFYRHPHPKRMTRECPFQNPRPWVKADLVEDFVIRRLFDLFGNPSLIEQAIKRSFPDQSEGREKLKRLNEAISQIERGRDRILRLVVSEVLKESQAQKQLHDLNSREDALQKEREGLLQSLANVPDEESIRFFVERIQCDGLPDSILLFDEEGNKHLGGNDVATYMKLRGSDEDQKALIDMAFAGMYNGKPAGVYFTPQPGPFRRPKPFEKGIEIRGLVDISQYGAVDSSS